ncbi:hypothetical protein P3G55_09295 [Leptospira sp. 96542]|nr:hypothetical protein [Leptospira sp. 96542]
MLFRFYNLWIWVFAIGFALIFQSPGLFADKLKLKNGEIIFGKAITVTSTHVEWQDKGKRWKFPHSDVLGMEIGYDGLPACADYKTFGEEDCDLVLHKLTKTTASFAKKTNTQVLEEVPIKKIAKLRVFPEEGLILDRYLVPGTKGIWTFSGAEYSGVLKKYESGFMVLEGDKSQTQRLEVKDFESFTLTNPSLLKRVIVEETPKIVPGYAPIQNKDYTKASLLFGGAALSGLGMWYEYNESIKAINADTEYLPTPDGRVLILTNTFGNKRYDFHRQRFIGYSVLFTLILSYSLIDSFYLGQMENKSNVSQAVFLKPIFGIENSHSQSKSLNLTKQQNPNESLFYGLHFETNF